jgi:hypothetical protein
MISLEAAVTAALTTLALLALFALTVAVLTFGGPGLALFAAGVVTGVMVPRPRQRQ